MKINGVKISNVLSFPYVEDIDNLDWVKLNPGINILIGPNGSGKSNFLEIISGIFQTTIIESCYFNDKAFDPANPQETKYIKAVDNINKARSFLEKHYRSKDKESAIILDLEFSEKDKENLFFIQKNIDELSVFATEYCDRSNFFAEADWNIEAEIIKNLKSVILRFNLVVNDISKTGEFSLISTDIDENVAGQAVKVYLRSFEYIQHLILAARKLKGKNWDQLYDLYQLIGGYRSYEGFIDQVTLNSGTSEQIKGQKQSARSGGIKNSQSGSTTFNTFFLDCAIKVNELHNSSKCYLENAIRKISNQELAQINKLCENYLDGIHIIVTKDATVLDNKYFFKFQNRENEDFPYQRLSSGQRSIIHLLYTIIGSRIRNGLIFIDEPEIYLHPSLQKRYFLLLKNLAKRYDLQVVMATHSSIFVDENTIQSVSRFYMQTGNTKIIKAGDLTTSDKNIVKILSYTNSSRIFFAKKVVLIEGESDEYFFNFYKNFKEIEDNVEFININGKGSYEVWMEFLDKFKIEAYFIGDWDNIIDTGIVVVTEIEKYRELVLEKIYPLVSKEIAQKGSKDRESLLKSLSNYLKTQDQEGLANLQILSDYLFTRQSLYGEIINYLKINEKSIFTKICNDITDKYADKIYILKDGEIEDYFSIDKGLDQMIIFCRNQFKVWIKKDSNRAKINEFNNIFGSIIN